MALTQTLSKHAILNHDKMWEVDMHIYTGKLDSRLFYSSNTLHLSTQNSGLCAFPPGPLVTTGLSENGTVLSFSGHLWMIFSYKENTA